MIDAVLFVDLDSDEVPQPYALRVAAVRGPDAVPDPMLCITVVAVDEDNKHTTMEHMAYFTIPADEFIHAIDLMLGRLT